MPIEYAIDDHNVLVLSASGLIEVTDRASIVRTLLSDASLPEVIPVLIDVTKVNNFPSIADIPRLAFLVEQLTVRFKSKVAYFVVQPGMVTPYHLVAFSIGNSRSSVCVFGNKAEAITWLTSAP